MVRVYMPRLMQFETLVKANRVKPYIHYMFGDWGAYSKCTADCGWGTKVRTRACQEVNLKTLQTVQTGLDAQLCTEANSGLEGEQTSNCMVRECSPCDMGTSPLGAFKYERLRNVTLVEDDTLPYDMFYRLGRHGHF